MIERISNLYLTPEEMIKPIEKTSFGPAFVSTLEEQIEPRVIDLTPKEIIILNEPLDNSIETLNIQIAEAEIYKNEWINIRELVRSENLRPGKLNRIKHLFHKKKERKSETEISRWATTINDFEQKIVQHQEIKAEISEGRVDGMEYFLLTHLKAIAKSWNKCRDGNNWNYQRRILECTDLTMYYMNIVNPDLAKLLSQKLKDAREYIEKSKLDENKKFWYLD